MMLLLMIRLRFKGVGHLNLVSCQVLEESVGTLSYRKATLLEFIKPNVSTTTKNKKHISYMS